MDTENFIEWVRHSENGSNIYVPAPDDYELVEPKLSKSTAKRTVNYYLNPEYVGRDIKIHLIWLDVPFETAQKIINAFDPERQQGIWVRFLSPRYGWITEEMICGDIPVKAMKREKVFWEKLEFDLTTKQTKWRA